MIGAGWLFSGFGRWELGFTWCCLWVALVRWFVGLLWVALGIRFYFPCVYCDDLF